MFEFAEVTRDMTASEILNYYRNLYYAEPQVTERGIVANAINDFFADVVPKSEEGAECPTCHGTGRIGTTNWLTKNISKKQLAEEKAKAIAEHERYIKTEVAREIFNDIANMMVLQHGFNEKHIVAHIDFELLKELKKKYTEGEK
jgi:hypothetical protein